MDPLAQRDDDDPVDSETERCGVCGSTNLTIVHLPRLVPDITPPVMSAGRWTTRDRPRAVHSPLSRGAIQHRSVPEALLPLAIGAVAQGLPLPTELVQGSPVSRTTLHDGRPQVDPETARANRRTGAAKARTARSAQVAARKATAKANRSARGDSAEAKRAAALRAVGLAPGDHDHT